MVIQYMDDFLKAFHENAKGFSEIECMTGR
jgi:hypothetical protein